MTVDDYIKNEKYYFEPLLDRWLNHYWNSDYVLFDFKDNKKATLLTKEVSINDIIPNFSESFFKIWKEVVDNWTTVFDCKEGVIKDGKIISSSLSIREYINTYKSQIKVDDCYKNREKYIKYIEDNKNLYSIIDYNNIGFINSLIYMPGNFKPVNKSYNYGIRQKFTTDSEVIYPFRKSYSDNFVLFMDFFEEVKEKMKYYPNCIKVLIKRNSLKRFFGITEINQETNYYFLSSVGIGESQFQDTTIEYFFLMNDGTIKGSN